jgi:hypothetical protein
MNQLCNIVAHFLGTGILLCNLLLFGGIAIYRTHTCLSISGGEVDLNPQDHGNTAIPMFLSATPLFFEARVFACLRYSTMSFVNNDNHKNR